MALHRRQVEQTPSLDFYSHIPFLYVFTEQIFSFPFRYRGSISQTAKYLNGHQMSKSGSEGSDLAGDDVPPPPETRNVDTDADECFADKAILYRFCSEKSEWVARGCGVLKVLKHKQTGVHRILMRQNQTYVVRANHQIPYLGRLDELPGSGSCFFWTAFDFSTPEETRELFAVKFALPAIAAAFKSAFEAGQAANRPPAE
jgi:hypothetical protein